MPEIPGRHLRWPYQSAKPMMLMMLQARARFNDPGRAFPGTGCPFCERANQEMARVLGAAMIDASVKDVLRQERDNRENECSMFCPMGRSMVDTVPKHLLREFCTLYGLTWFKAWKDWLEMEE